MFKMPLNLLSWIDENRELLKPPVGNKKIYEDSDFMVFVVGGPNQRKDYHIDTSEEFFYQIEGEMTLKLVVDGEHQDVPIKAGEIFLLPANIPHSPQRPADTVGLVIENKRQPGAKDGLRWYCDGCGEVLHEAWFPLTDIVVELKAALQAFEANDEQRTCGSCGHYLEL